MTARPLRRLTAVTAGLMLVTDVGFLVYWSVIVTGVLPASVMFEGYAQPRVAAWNWSFLPLDLAASLTGLVAVRAWRRGSPAATGRFGISLALTSTAGLMALAYWAQLGEFDLAWWAPNLFLLLFPLPLLAVIMRGALPPAASPAAIPGPPGVSVDRHAIP